MALDSNHRNVNNEKNDMDDIEYFIISDIPMELIHQVLKAKNKNEKEIDEVVDKISASREKVRKAVNKFLTVVNTHYGHLDVPDLLKVGLKHADKYGLTSAEKKLFKDRVLKGDSYNIYSQYTKELKFSEMGKFLGYDYGNGMVLKLQPKDHAKLNELHMLYDATKHIYSDLRSQTMYYRDCAPEAINGTYNRNLHNVSVHVHPVIAALFLPKISYLEKRMLNSNIGRVILRLGQAYLKNPGNQFVGGATLNDISNEYEMVHDIANDPNSLAYFPNDTPIDNLIKRFRVQIELWQNVLNLRQGKYFSSGYDENDGISGFLKIINSYEWTFFDSPDLFHVQDEGTLLRKLLAVFSCRPTFTQLSDFVPRYGMGYTTVTNLARTTFINIPIVNIKLPLDISGNSENFHRISLTRALSQVDTFVEHKMIVPKNKSVIYSNSIGFFYANRRYPSINFNQIGHNQYARFVNIPTSLISTTTINSTLLMFENRMRIGKEWFNLRSVVVLQRSPIENLDVAVGCSAMIAVPNRLDGGLLFNFNVPLYLHYNPQVSSLQFLDETRPRKENESAYFANSPITFVDEFSDDPSKLGFRNEAQSRGTIFCYVNEGSVNTFGDN